MNDSLVRKFCESPHRKLTIIIVTTLFGLLVLIPLVDDYIDNKASHSALTDDLDRARQTEAGLPEIEKQVGAIVQKLYLIESRTISDNSVSSYRSKIVELVRDAGCQVRRFDVSTPTRRPWTKNDDPLVTTAKKEKGAGRTPFALERRNFVLLVDGSMENLSGLLEQLQQDNSIAYLHRLDLHSTSRGSEQVTMEIEMWLFDLSRQKV